MANGDNGRDRYERHLGEATHIINGPIGAADFKADEIYKLYADKKDVEGLARLVSPQDIEEEGYNLSIARYVQKPFVNEELPVPEALARFKADLQRLEECDEKLEMLLRKEGLLK